jgi:hypothetical protein
LLQNYTRKHTLILVDYIIYFQIDYDYSRIDGSIIDETNNTFDSAVTLQYLFSILGVIALMIIIGAAFDIYNLYRRSGKIKQESSGIMEPPHAPALVLDCMQ